MHPARRVPGMRWIGAWVTLAALSAVAVLSLTQCRVVPDTVTGLAKHEQASPGQCMSGCAHQYNDSLTVERDLHKDNVHACGGDSICLALEDARHEAAVERIQQGRKQCQEECHHQGGGNGR